ncbi:EP300-interacting inhibitor of differentiation 3-like isoform X2 [Pecten maximus]|uniref:EP300-interacting inhibitor of differentiation 3-like isoform X2 n=1 Tax=Pecten maximus TaxID=6579 RepID=UPI001457F922|nr:EP300-interacting inhibitor of differentiation 3-like isoform X2 [Pecten maximus]
MPTHWYTANRHDFISPSSNRLDEALTETDELVKNVKLSSERVLDSLAVRIISTYGRQKALAVQTDFIKFVPEEFAEKLITFIGGRHVETPGPLKISSEGWSALGKSTRKFFSKSPAFHLMSGTFQKEPVAKPIKPVVKIVKEKEHDKEKTTVPKKIDSFDDVVDLGTSQHVARVFKFLQSYYQELGNRPICYFSFVLDPKSFGRTVENIFHTSFLVMRGLAKVSLDEDKLPQIEPVQNEENGEGFLVNQRNHQTIITITPADWKELVESFSVENAAISHTSQATT